MTAPTYSILRFMGRYTAGNRGLQFGNSLVARPAAPALPPADHAAIKQSLIPLSDALAVGRNAHLHRVERKMRLAVAGVVLAGVVFGWFLMGEFLGGLALMAIGIVFVLLVIFGAAQKAPRADAQIAVAQVVGAHLTDFTVDPDPVVPRQSLARLRLLQRVRKVVVDLRVTANREGRRVAVTRMAVMFGEDRNYKEKADSGLTFVMVEIGVPETAGRDGFAVVMPVDASWNLRNVPKWSHGLKAVRTQDAAFDDRYTVYGDAHLVTPAIRAGFNAIEAQARCAKLGLTEVPAGTGLRPWVAILPGELVVLTPLSKYDGAFEPPPFWEPIDPDVLIPAFAADFAVLDGYLSAALSLPVGDPA